MTMWGRVQVMVGSYFVVGGAFFGLFNPGKMGLLGVMLTGWGLYKEGAFSDTEEAEMYPMFITLVICCFLSLRLKQGLVKFGNQSNGRHVPQRVHVE